MLKMLRSIFCFSDVHYVSSTFRSLMLDFQCTYIHVTCLYVHLLSCHNVKLYFACVSWRYCTTTFIESSSGWLPGEWADKGNHDNLLPCYTFLITKGFIKICFCLLVIYCLTFLYLRRSYCVLQLNIKLLQVWSHWNETDLHHEVRQYLLWGYKNPVFIRILKLF